MRYRWRMVKGALVNKVQNARRYESSQHLASHIREDLVPGEALGCRQAKCYCRIQVSTAYCACDIDTKHDCKTPTKCYDWPGICKWSGCIICTKVIEGCKGSYTTVTEENKDHCAEEFANYFSDRPTEGGRSAYSLCHEYLLHFCGLGNNNK